MENRMTKGSIAGTLIRFSIPLVLSGILQQLYSWTDALIVGNYVGEAPLAAIGATGTLSTLFIATIVGLSSGVGVFVAQAFGEGDRESITGASSAFVLLLAPLSMLLSCAGILLARPLLRLLGTPADIFDLSAKYLRIVLLGLPCLTVYNLYSAVLRGIGDSRTPFLAIAVSSLCNVALDFLFVAVFRMGVSGAAVATVLSQLMMAVFLVIFSARRHPLLRLRMAWGSLRHPGLRKGMSLGLPMALQSGVRSIGGLMLQNIMNSFGSQVVAAISTAYRIDSLALLPTINIGAGVSTFSGQNKGAGDLRRARRGLGVGSIIALMTSLATTAVFVLFGAQLMRMFGITEGAVMIGREFLRFCAVFYPLFGIYNAFLGYLQGMGDVRFVSFASISSLALRIVLSYALSGILGHRVIAVSEMASWVYGLLLCLGRYCMLWREKG